MSRPRFFVEGVHAPGAEIELRGEDARKLTLVLRKRVGDEIEVCDSAGRAYVATLSAGATPGRALLGAEIEVARRPGLELALAQGVPKGSKMDFVVEKATELGIAKVLPFVSERTQGSAAERAGKLERWRRLARSAAQQCGRRDVPVVEPPVDWATLCAGLGAYERALVPWELAGAEPLRDVLPGVLAGARSVVVVIGPEGGLSHAEVELARAAGALTLSLGSRILRTETAGVVACSAILYAAGDL